MPNISGYSLYRKDRESIHGHGGVYIYVRSDLKSFEILSIGENERGMEQIWCGISKCEEKFIVECMYRPPDSDPRVLRELLKSIQRAKEKVDSGDFKSLIVCGILIFLRFTGQRQGVG